MGSSGQVPGSLGRSSNDNSVSIIAIMTTIVMTITTVLGGADGGSGRNRSRKSGKRNGHTSRAVCLVSFLCSYRDYKHSP